MLVLYRFVREEFHFRHIPSFIIETTLQFDHPASMAHPIKPVITNKKVSKRAKTTTKQTTTIKSTSM